MKKKGFTLIELMAVIVILGLIAVIVAPIIITSIKNARKGAAEVTFDNILESAKLYVSQSSYDQIKKSRMDGTTNLINYLDFDGERPTVGVVNARADNSIAMAILLNGMCYSKTYSGDSLVKSNPVDGNCTLPSPYNIVTRKYNEPLDAATFDLLTKAEYQAINSLTSSEYTGACDRYTHFFVDVNGKPTLSRNFLMPSTSTKKYKITRDSLYNNTNIKSNISQVVSCDISVDATALIKINIPNGNRVMQVDFDLLSYGTYIVDALIFAMPSNATSQSDLVPIDRNMYLYDDEKHISFTYEKGTEDYIVLVIDLEADYTAYGESGRNDGLVIDNLEVSFGGLTDGNSAFILENGTYTDAGIETQTGVSITDTKYINRVSSIPTPLRKGLYDFKYELETLSGFKTFTRKVYVGYESLYSFINPTLYLNYVPDNLTAYIKGNYFEEGAEEVFSGFEYRGGCITESVLLYFVDASGNVVYSKSFTLEGSACR